LGTQCPDDAPCIVASDSGAPPARPDSASPSVDSGVPTQPTEPVPDADVVEPQLSAFPAIQNRGFDLNPGSNPGDISTLSSTVIAPWYSCQPISGGDNPTTAVRAESSVMLSESETPAGAVVTPRDGSGTFISMQYLVKFVPIPLVQRLAEPLHASEHYALAVDVQSPNLPAMLSLQLRGSTEDDPCLDLNQDLLVESDPVTTPGWQTLCLPFTGTADYKYLVLSLQSGALLGGALMTTSARLFFDNMRPATRAECPNL
jgi:hypothetical protein